MIALLAFFVRLAVLAGFTFGFVVLFEHGTQGFVTGAPVELGKFEDFLLSLKNPKVDEPVPEAVPVTAPPPSIPAPAPAASAIPASAPPTAPASNASNSTPSAWEQLQSKPMGKSINEPLATPFPTKK